MAKRKRLSPMISDYQPDTDTAPKPAMRAPIADVAADASASAALAELSQTLQDARAKGRMVIEVPLAQIETDFLVRDRLGADADEMATLVASIEARGQQTPIEVIELDGGRFGLISGWRRCEAVRQLGQDMVLALVRQPDDQAESYLAMVEENEIRVGLSYYERARIAVKATAQGAFEDEDEALKRLYASASRAKRSKIRSFVAVYHALDADLRFADTLGERLGLQIAQHVQKDTSRIAALRAALAAADITTSEQEQDAIKQALSLYSESTKKPSRKAKPKPRTPVPEVRRLRGGVQARLFEDGRIEIEGAGLTPDLRDALLGWLNRSLG
ncbi:ParB N-terminal domain-containing protein [Sulfitobacter sp. HNIBRBA2951]|uniref:ParB/RepB/Spo0J family partition protein n=1 Tax=Sulfitobacter aquimarinus TaxID=3158557 RepID=UPI0032E002B1